MALAVALLSAAQAIVPQAAIGQTATALLGQRAKAPVPVPPLESTAPGRPRPGTAVGDFAGAPPHPDQRSAEPAAARASFDPARSKLVESETTPTKLVYGNRDGSETAILSQTPVRFNDPTTGTWRDLDPSVVATPDGLAARALPSAATLGSVARGSLATVSTPAGEVVVRHPDALAVPGVAAGDAATYAKALPGGRDLVVRPLAGGFTE
ncbi:MAG: hypothetical protein ACRD2W_12970, partial [Acidimicrobiales bacterium]